MAEHGNQVRGAVRLIALSAALCVLCSAQFRVSVSVSPFTESVFARGVVYTDGELTARDPGQLQRLFVKYGANEVYARIATTRRYTTGSGDHSLTRGLDRARLAAAVHLPFNPELGLFNIYGDVRCQPAPDFSDDPDLKPPATWTSLRIDQMQPILSRYAAKTAREILATGVKVRIWDLGNEVDFGVAGVAVHPLAGGCDDTAGGAGWYRPPDQVDTAIGKMSVADLMRLPEAKRITWLEQHLWPHMAKLFAAVVRGIRAADPDARFSTHLSGMSATRSAQAVAFFRAMRDGGYAPDELGLSCYPSSSGEPLEDFQKTVAALREKLGRPVFVAEFAYSSRPITGGPFKDWNHPLKGYPLTPEGQADIYRALVQWGKTNGLSGIRPWAPDFAAPGWGPMSLFTMTPKTATAAPALGVFRLTP